MNSYYNPVHTIQGPGSIEKIPELLSGMELPHKRVLLLAWNPSVFELPVFHNLIKSAANFTFQTLSFQESNPTVEQLYETYQKTAALAPDVVIAVGGGSTLDMGKSLCCLYGKEISDIESLRSMIQQKAYGTIHTRWIGVPTTAGTGSEVTCWATIWDPSKDAKRSVESKENYAYAAVVDPALTAGMPAGLAVSSALDAVAHAVESYWAKATNDVSRALALNAIRIIMGAIDGLPEGEQHARDCMSLGSMMAGLAFSNTKTTACHSISYPLTMHYHIPHGTAVSLLLAPVLRLNASQVKGLPELLQALGVKDAGELQVRIKGLLSMVHLPATLREWNMPEDEIPMLAQMGFTKGRADNNPVEINAGVIESILKEIY